MIYGLYLSATGVMTSSYRQDVLANNIANADTVGFKRDTTSFNERLTEAQARRAGQGLFGPADTNGLLDNIGGGLLASPTGTDHTQGGLEATGNPLDVAIQGNGFLQVKDGDTTRLTRDGRLMLNRQGEVILANGTGQKVLDGNGKILTLDAALMQKTSVGPDGTITQNGKTAGKLGVVDVADRSKLLKRGGNLLDPGDGNDTHPVPAMLRSGFVELSNVDPTKELTQLMEAQRQLEANAQMIRYQDTSLGRLVNDVAKIG